MLEPLWTSHHDSVRGLIGQCLNTHNKYDTVLLFVATVVPERVVRSNENLIGAEVVTLEIKVIGGGQSCVNDGHENVHVGLHVLRRGCDDIFPISIRVAD